MKIIKKCLIVIVSLFVILATQPVNVFADPTTRYFADLEPGDFIAKDDIVKYDSSGVQNFTVSTGMDYIPPANSYTADRDYFIVNIYDGYENSLYLTPAAYVSVYLDSEIQGDTYIVPSNLPFVVNKEMNNLKIGDKVNYSPSIPAGRFAKWTWKSTNPSYTAEQPYDEGYQGMVAMSNFLGDDFSLYIYCTTYETQNLTSLSVTGSGTIEKNTTATYYVHLIDQNGNEIKDEDKTISYIQVDSSETEISGTGGTITFSDGYSFSITPDTAGDLYYKFSLNSIDAMVHIVVEEAEGNSIIENNGWPWATKFNDTNENVTLQTGLINVDSYNQINYQWEYSADKDGTYANCESATSQTYTTPNGTTSGTWYRCKISYKVEGTELEFTDVYTKSVQIIDTDSITLAAYDDMMTYNFVSNGKGAYTYNIETGKFNVLGLWNGSWVCTSYDPSWSIYMKKTGSEITANTHMEDAPWGQEEVIDSINTENIVQPSNINSVYVRFSNYDNSNVIFDVKFTEACDVAIFSDVAMGSDEFFGDDADNAAVKANMNGNSLGNIQMFASPNFADASYHTCSFVFTPILKSIHNGLDLNNVSTFTIDSFGNGDGNFNEYVCNDDPSYDSIDYPYSYDALVFSQQYLIFKYNTGWWPEQADWYDYDPFIYKNIGGQNVSIGMYEEDSILAASWVNTSEISFMFGIGKAGELPGVTWDDIESEEEHHHHGGGTWIEVPNTSASVR